jgi:SAM-dependent methyltransferase
MAEDQTRLEQGWPVPAAVRDCDERTKRMTFDQFVGQTNMMPDCSFQPLFTQLVLKELAARKTPAALDIGCGTGIGRFTDYTRVISANTDALWGVEPDETIEQMPGVFHSFQHALLEDAQLPENHFDVAYAAFVMEHVADPGRFLQAVHRALKPGGSFLFLTPNASAFFGRVSRMLNRVGLDERILRMIKRTPESHAYHYPIVSKCNRVKEVDLFARQVGFAPPQFAFFQFAGSGGYFPGPLRLFYGLLLAKRRLFNNPEALDSMVCRLTKPHTPE